MASSRPSSPSNASVQRTPTWFERAGCWAVGVYAFALYFAVAALVTILNGDVLRMLESGVLAVLLVIFGVWLARRNVAKGSGPARPDAAVLPRLQPRRRKR